MDRNRKKKDKKKNPIIIKELKEQYILREFELKFKDIFDFVNESIAISDQDDKLVYFNDKFSNLLNYSKNELIGNKVRDFISEDFKDNFKKETIEREKAITPPISHQIPDEPEESYETQNSSSTVAWTCDTAGRSVEYRRSQGGAPASRCT